MFKRFLEWLIEWLLKIDEWLFGDEPKTRIVWEIRIFPGKQGAVRKAPNAGWPVAWLLAENESAVVRLNDDGTPAEVIWDGLSFYYIAFGEKRGWILFKKDRMEFVPKEVPV